MTDDQSRLVATRPDNEFTVTIDEALERYSHAGLPRTPRSIQRYCAKGHLECRLIETSFGEKYLISPESIDKHIAYIEEVRPAAASRGKPRPVATSVAENESPEKPRHEPAPSTDLSRPVATYVSRLEGENEFLRGQIGAKDRTIEALLERDRETNHLIAGLQQMLTPLLGRPEEPRTDVQPQ
jgi:hypothetical protein